MNQKDPLAELQEVIDADERAPASPNVGVVRTDVVMRPSALRAGMLGDALKKHTSAVDEMTATIRKAIADCERATANLKALIGER